MYAIQYNKQTQCLEFSYDNHSHLLALNGLFHNFGLSLANTVLRVRNAAVCRVSNGGTHAILYDGDMHYNELITDIIFLHGIYQEHQQHHTGFLDKEKFESWQKVIQKANQKAILKKLYSNRKISRAYYFKYTLNHPASLYDLVKYNLFISNTLGNEDEAEKIDTLALPNAIKQDLKLSFK